LKIQNRITTKSNTAKYELYKEKLIELCKKDGQATSRTFAACIFPPLCESGARKWLARFKADGIIKLVARSNAGRQIFVLADHA
jgi:predicted HTH transcriptional regulator